MLDLYVERQKRRFFGSRRRTLSTLTLLATIIFIGIALCIVGVGLLFAWYAKDLPRPDKVQRVEGLSTVISDRNGINLYDIFQDENRIPVTSGNIPDYLKKATVSVEDKDFYKHQGLSTSGIIRAMINIFIFRNLQGGSTLTQQLVKNALLTQERTVPRKIKEAILSIQIERKYTKDEILTMYLNEAPYGGTAVGVESAAEYYFAKAVKDLNLLECALLAGLPQSPSRYSPFTGSSEKLYIWRTQQVLRRMREDGYITKTQEDQANKQLTQIKFADPSVKLKAPHFVAYVKDLLVAKFGQQKVESEGLKVTTTLDWKLQEKAQSIVADEVAKDKYLKLTNGSAVVLDPKTGEILAMVGSKDYTSSDSGGYKFNVATQGLRQPGSSIKPITYATAFKKGYTPATLLMDVDTKYPSGDPKIPEYEPKNYDGKFRGPMQLRYALGNSINTIAVKVMALVGVKDVLHTAYDMGLSTLEPTDANMKRFGLSLTLGGGEVKLLDLSGAYAVFATGGLKSPPVAILKVQDAKGNLLYEYKPAAPERVLPENVAYLISSILSDNNARKEEFGLNSSLVVSGKTVAVKTGTTDDKRDNWTLGYTKNRVVGVWVGNNDNSPMNQTLASGITGAAPIWNRIMKEAIADQKDEPFLRPSDVVEMDIDGFGGGLPVDGMPTRKEVFIKGTEPTGPAAIYQDVKVSIKDENKLANVVDINKGEFKLKKFYIFKEQDDVSTDGKNRWQEAIDAWVNAQGDAKYHPPTETYSGNDQVSLKFVKPGDNNRINNNSVEIRAEAASLNDISKIELFVDGNKVNEVSDKILNYTASINNGNHTISAKATDNKGNTSQHDIHVGINQDYQSPTPAPSSTPTPTP
jgi:1A family penicillin-binding protein